jgi:hypothetical protein
MNIKMFCSSSNRLQNYQRNFFFLKLNTNRGKSWTAFDIRNTFRQLNTMIKDDEKGYKHYKREVELLEELVKGEL